MLPSACLRVEREPRSGEGLSVKTDVTLDMRLASDEKVT